MTAPRVALAPDLAQYAAAAVQAGGGDLVGLDEAPDALVWTQPASWATLRDTVAWTPSLRWVQLPFAGIEPVVAAGALVPDLVWTCAKGVYSEPVAEHALALTLAGLRSLPMRARATSWGPQGADTLLDAKVAVLGAGGITTSLLRLLAPFRADVTVLRRNADRPVADAARTVGIDRLDDVLPEQLVVVLALALTPRTEHVIGRRQLAAMARNAWLVNVARGRHIDTEALVEALQVGAIGGAALDVTDPEPLPDGHPLWRLPNCLITPHTANPWDTAQPLLARQIRQNVQRYAAGAPLLGLVDVVAGY